MGEGFVQVCATAGSGSLQHSQEQLWCSSLHCNLQTNPHTHTHTHTPIHLHIIAKVSQVSSSHQAVTTIVAGTSKHKHTPDASKQSVSQSSIQAGIKESFQSRQSA